MAHADTLNLDDYTIMLPAKTSAAVEQYLMSKSAVGAPFQVELRFQPSGQIRNQITDLLHWTTVLSPLTYNDGKVHQITTVREKGVKLYLYVDGVLVHSVDDLTDDITSASDLYIGVGSRDAGSQPFSGIIDEARIYNRALNAAEVKRHYESELLLARH